MENGVPQTLQETIKFLADGDRAFNFAVSWRWPNGVTCPVCEGEAVSFIPSEKRWNCRNKECRKRFSVKTGTVMEQSPLKIETWLAGMWLVANAKNGISSHEIARSLGITQKTAWFLRARVQEIMQEDSPERFTGTVEADETAVGGLEKNKHLSKRLHAGTGTVGKQLVMGIVERESGTVRTKHIPNTQAVTLESEVLATVEEAASVYTDSWRGYRGLGRWYNHETVNHLVEYVRGEVHTNSVEGFWNLFKRCFKGTWTHLSEAHLRRYVTEQEWRYNTRKGNDGSRFAALVVGCSGKRLTWKELTER